MAESAMGAYAATVAIRCGIVNAANLAAGEGLNRIPEAFAIATIKSRATESEARYYAPRVGAVADAEYIRVFKGLINW